MLATDSQSVPSQTKTIQKPAQKKGVAHIKQKVRKHAYLTFKKVTFNASKPYVVPEARVTQHNSALSSVSRVFL
jgi:hypothetical protein